MWQGPIPLALSGNIDPESKDGFQPTCVLCCLQAHTQMQQDLAEDPSLDTPEERKLWSDLLSVGGRQEAPTVHYFYFGLI